MGKETSKKTGIPMSRIENTNTIKSVKCDCKKCFHFTNNHGIPYCKYYDRPNPHKPKCIRFIEEKDYSHRSLYIVVNAIGHRLRDFPNKEDAYKYAAQVNAKVSSKESAVFVIEKKKLKPKSNNRRKKVQKEKN